MADELAAVLGQRFIERRDVKAEQQKSGIYTPVTDTGKPDGVRQSFTMSDLRAHLDGSRTFGHYLVSQENKARVFAFDLDLVHNATWVPRHPFEWTQGAYEAVNPRAEWASHSRSDICEWLTCQLRQMADSLAGRIQLLGCRSAIAYSGSKGLHVYGFTGSEPAEKVRGAALMVLESFGHDTYKEYKGHWFHKSNGFSGYPAIEIEVYPKQASIREGDGLGNLLRLPLGVNRKSGKAGFFVDPNSPHNELRELDPMVALSL